MKLKLTPRLTLIFILFASCILIATGRLVYNNGRRALEAATITELESTASEKEGALDGWILEREATLRALANSPYILAELKTFIADPNTTDAYERLTRELSVHTGPGQAFLTLFLLSPESGKVIVSVDPSELGGLRVDLPYFVKGRTRTYTTSIYFSPDLLVPAMTTSTPVRSEDGQLLAVLAGRLNLDELNTIIQRRTGLRQTDDAFLVNSSNLFVTQPRFIPDSAVLKIGVHTEPVQRCLQQKSGTINAMDYRGIPVIASYRWLPDREMCLIVKITEAEALAPVQKFGQYIAWITLGTFLAASWIALFLSKAMLSPITAMQIAAQRYGRGELDVRLPETRQDELGILAREFNRMAGALAEKEWQLRQYAHTLEQKIQERTQALAQSENKFKYIWEHSIVGKSLIDPDGTLHANKAFCDMLGYSEEQVHNKKWQDFTPQEDVELTRQIIAPLLSGEMAGTRFTKRYLHKDGSIVWGDVSIVVRRNLSGELLYFMTTVVDITERKAAEARLHDLLVFNEKILNTVPVGMLTFNVNGQCTFANENAASIIGTTPGNLMVQNFRELESWKRSGLYQLAEKAIASSEPVMEDVHHLSTFGKDVWLRASAVTFRSKEEEQMLLTISDITERKQMEEALRQSEEHYRLLFNEVRHGFALHEVICSEAGEPVDYRYLEINPAFETLTGLRARDLVGRTVREVLPGTESYWIESFGRVAMTGEPVEFSQYSQELGKYYEVSAYSPKPGQFAVIFMDVTERKHAEEAIQRVTEDLRRSNAELEQFAYVASHDLQEPLRMVSSYVQLLGKRYQGKLDRDADEFIAYAVDGAKRMQNLINDLLAYSRVGTRGEDFSPVSTECLFEEAIANLQFAIEDSRATITHDPLPVVRGDSVQLVQVIQNLLGNAIKFRGDEPPCIHVGVQKAEGEWIFSVRDNGIGIDPKFADRIFIIFQRLNDRTVYPGTGIGLAICKRIVLRHGGRIWVESALGRGSTFYFTLPLSAA